MTDNCDYDLYWCGDKGIQMRVIPTIPQAWEGAYHLAVNIKGMDIPEVFFRVDGIDIKEQAIREWLDGEGYLAKWHEEAATYKRVLSQVQLPYCPLELPQLKVGALDVSKALVYELSTGDDDSFYIEMLVVVRPDIVSIDVGLIDGDENGPVYTYMGVCSTTLPLTMDSLKAAVNPVVEEFVGRVRALMGLPVLSLY